MLTDTAAKGHDGSFWREFQEDKEGIAYGIDGSIGKFGPMASSVCPD